MAVDLQSEGSTHSDGKRAPSLPPPEIVQYIYIGGSEEPQHLATLEESILLKYWFDENDTPEQKQAMAKGLMEECRVLNYPWERHRVIRAMFTQLYSIPGIDEVLKALPEDQLKRNDDDYGNGNTAINWNTEDLLIFEPFIVEKFLAFPGCGKKMDSEGSVEKIVGNLLKGIVAGSDFIDRE